MQGTVLRSVSSLPIQFVFSLHLCTLKPFIYSRLTAVSRGGPSLILRGWTHDSFIALSNFNNKSNYLSRRYELISLCFNILRSDFTFEVAHHKFSTQAQIPSTFSDLLFPKLSWRSSWFAFQSCERRVAVTKVTFNEAAVSRD